MNKLNILFSLSALLFSLNSYSAEKEKLTFENADSLYQNGNCEKAIPAYQGISPTGLTQADTDKILFRVSYCQFSLGNYQESELGFKKYLTTHSGEEEAILKYSQSLLYQSKYTQAEEYALQVQSADFKSDAAIVIARAQIETNRPEKAIGTLKAHTQNAEALYWLAVAQYNNDQDSEAENTFSAAIKKTNNDYWVHTESKAWLERIKSGQRKFHLRLTVGAFKDTNIDQSGGTGTINLGGPEGGPGGGQGGQGGPSGPGTSKASFANTNYTADNGKYAALDLIYNTYNSRKLSLTTTASFSSPFYSKNPTYNQESASLDLNLRKIETSTFNYGASLKYLDTFYDNVYSQDYIYFTPTASWSFSPEYWLKFSIPITKYLNNKKVNLYGGSLDLYYDPANWISIAIGGSTTKSSAPEAVLKDFGSGPKVVSGTMFSHYSSVGAYLSFTFYFADTYQLGVTGSTYKTKYDLEKIPGNIKHTPREDKLKSYQFSFTKTFIRNVLSANLSYSYSDNKSTGFPGLISSGSVSNNTYTRGYSLLTLEYYY